MGSLIHIAEVAVLIFAAYVVGWFVGYALRRAVTRPARATAVAVAATAQAVAAATQSADALVRAPVVVPVTASTPPHLQAKVTQIEPSTAIAVPDGMVLAEPKSIDVPKVPTAPVSALESLKSLTTAIPLAPIELRPIVAPTEPVQVRAVIMEPTAPTVAPEVTPAATEAPTDVAFAAPTESELAPEPERPTVGAPPPAAVPVVEEPSLAAEPALVATAPEPVIAEPEPVIADVGLELEPEPEPVVVAPAEPAVPPRITPLAMPSSLPGVAWSGAIKGREAAPFERVADAAATAEAEGQGGAPAGLDVSLLESLADELEVDEPALPVDQLDELAAVAESNASPQVSSTEITEPAIVELIEPAAAEIVEPPETEIDDLLPPAVEPVAEAAVAAPEPEIIAAPSPARSEFDEDAAMRAIEGGWSRRQTRAMSDAYQLTDVTAAVSAAQVAVEQVLAANGIDAGDGTRAQSSFGKPRGLPHARNNRRDNLKQINGLGPLDESTLNNMGIYHFDQVAGWDQKEVLWLENHAFARGRIGREDWQGQARSLMVDGEAARRIGG